MRAEQEWILHEAGYDYESIPRLTRAEIRRLHEGKRVHQKIKQLTRELSDDDGGFDSTAQGRVVPRESDERKLREWRDRLDSSAEVSV